MSPTLRPEHREHLRGSGLSDETIAAARIASVSPEQARRLGYASGLSGIAFPYPGTEIVVDGEPHAYTRLLDNVSQALDSESLAAVLTAEVWADRLLGQTRVVEVPNRALWLATANNPVVSRENARRSVRIRLDAAVERPWLREGFRHADLRAWVRAQRGRLLGALITLVRGWIDDGRPEGTVRLGSFEAWSRVVGGVLASAGVPGFLADRHDESEVADPDEAEWGAFVALWAERHGATRVDGGVLLALAAEARMFGLDAAGPSMPRERSRFSRALAKRRDRLYGGLRLSVGRDTKRRQNVYALVGA